MTSNPADQGGSTSDWPRPAVSVMVFRDDLVLLGQRGKAPLAGKWSLPGGRIEPGETVHDAGRRELLEETGVEAEIIGEAATRDITGFDLDGDVSVHYVLTVLLARWTSGEGSAASDCLDVAWVRPSELDRYVMTEGTADLVRSVSRRMGTNLDAISKAL